MGITLCNCHTDSGNNPTTRGSNLPFEQVHLLDTDLFGGVFETFGKDPSKAERNFRMLRQQISEVRARQHEDDSRLNGGDRGGSVLSPKQRHFTNCCVFRQLRYQKFDAGCGIFLADLD
jgi:hypothetical protein